jgi:hypothetical protein
MFKPNFRVLSDLRNNPTPTQFVFQARDDLQYLVAVQRTAKEYGIEMKGMYNGLFVLPTYSMQVVTAFSAVFNR